MSNRGDNHILQELSLLTALDIVNAKVDTTTIPEIRNISKAAVGKFYGAKVEQPLTFANRPSELVTLGTPVVAVNIPGSATQITHGAFDYAQIAVSELIPICLSSQDEAAWTEFVRRFQPLITAAITRAVLRRGHRSIELIDDLVQNTFIKLFANGGRALRNFGMRHEKTFYDFLKVVANRVVQDHFGYAASANRGGPFPVFSEPADYQYPTANPSKSEQNVLVQEMERLLQLNSKEPNFERDHKIFWLYYRDRLTAQEISELPGMVLSTKGVESTLRRMTRQIRQHLSPPASKKK